VAVVAGARLALKDPAVLQHAADADDEEVQNFAREQLEDLEDERRRLERKASKASALRRGAS
jgi:hypothetical protein